MAILVPLLNTKIIPSTIWVAASFPVSAKLGFAAFLLAVVIGVAAGVIAALKQNTRWDYAVMGVAMTGVVIPSFVVAPLLVMIFAITLHWLPGGGWNGGALKFMILPMVALFPGLYRQHRAYHPRLND
ncbi:Oligopeptide transport system permease OppB [Klebsiella pneumoniae]|uniref:Oligopeptide transport system permease OppB n=1 Tax=Klebsiella pneumoniae TaxID=573 RepID=A0A2X3EK68_KLEPN|nr:Oligopeptide transport system permease OppB [Klebsiella pneumoniae]